MKEKKYLAMFSGGRDSTAMVELLLRQNKPLDYIVFTDTLHEFDEMYIFIDKFNNYLKEKYNRQITILKPSITFEDFAFDKLSRGEREGKIRGIPMTITPCYWKREAKVKPAAEFIKSLGDVEVFQYIGYVYSEKKRIMKEGNFIYPLIDAKMCEANVDELLEEINMVNPLYQFFERTGCYFCPYQKERSLFVLYKQFPKKWQYMKDIEKKLKPLDTINGQWNINHTIDEKEFIFNNNRKFYQIEAPKSCECSIEIDINQQSFDF